MTLKPEYIAAVAASVAANSEIVPNASPYEDSEWEARLIRCSRRLLSAVVFREMAQVTLEATRSSLLPVVGFYYCMFHAGVAMLCVDPATPLSEIAYSAKQGDGKEPGVTHKKVRRLLKERLEETGVLAAVFLLTLNRMKALREQVNYSVGGRLPQDHIIETLDEGALYPEVGDCLDVATQFVKAVSSIVRVGPTMESTGLQRIRSTIGDHFGDDLIHLYVPREYRARVWDYLVSRGLTT